MLHTVDLFADGVLDHLYNVLFGDLFLLGRENSLGAEHIIPLGVLVRVLCDEIGHCQDQEAKK